MNKLVATIISAAIIFGYANRAQAQAETFKPIENGITARQIVVGVGADSMSTIKMNGKTKEFNKIQFIDYFLNRPIDTKDQSLHDAYKNINCNSTTSECSNSVLLPNHNGPASVGFDGRVKGNLNTLYNLQNANPAFVNLVYADGKMSQIADSTLKPDIANHDFELGCVISALMYSKDANVSKGNCDFNANAYNSKIFQLNVRDALKEYVEKTYVKN